MISEISDSVLAAARKMGYKEVRKQQMQAVSEFVKGKDVFVALPTRTRIATQHSSIILCR